MADILIRGKDLLLPERSGKILDVMLFADGTIQYGKHYGYAFELPEHGDLIDRDALIKTCNEIIDEDWNAKAAPYSWPYAYESFVDDIEEIPVVIQSNKEEPK